MVGIVLSAYAIPQVLLRIPIGIWSDSLGKRKPLVIIGIVFTSLGALGLGLSVTTWLLFLSRMTTGIGASAWVVFPLYFTAYFRENGSDKAIGIINFVRSIALISATAVSGFIAEGFGLNQPFFIAAALGVVALFALSFTKESKPSKVRPATWSNFRNVVTRPKLIIVSIAAILLHFATFTGVFGFLPVYSSSIGASSGELGLITMINLGFSAFGALSAVWICRKLGYRLTIICSALLISSSLLAIPFINTIPLIMTVQISCGFGSGILMTLFMVLSIRGLRPEQQATAMGVFQAVYAIGMFAGPITSGFLGSGLGLSTVFYLSGSLALLISVMAFLPIFNRHDG